MKKPIPLLFLFWILILFPPSSWSQLILGQYEDEAPFRTWNTFSFATAPSLGLGESHFSLASDCSVALSNPALLVFLPKTTFTLNTSFNSASFFKYSMINTGVLSSEKNIYLSLYALDFGGISLRLKSWAFALSQALLETYDRPQAKYDYFYQGNLYYSLNFTQKGVLKNLNFSLSRKFSRRIAIGLGLNFVYGDLKKEITEEWISDDITIRDSLSQKFKGLFLNGGFLVELSDTLSVAAVFRTPYIKKSDSQSLLRYSSPRGGTDIKIEASSKDKYKQPLVIGIGAGYKVSPQLRFGADLSFFNWSRYKVDYFEETQERNFKDTLKIGAGMEYSTDFQLFEQKFDLPFRVGLSYDRQPMKEPISSYLYYSLGIGLHWKGIFLDLGAFLGSERGSGNSLSAKKVALSLTFQL